MLLDKSIKELRRLLDKGEISSCDLIEEAYGNIELLDSKLHAFITVRDKEEVLKEAKESDSRKDKLPLNGIPFCIKDAYVTKDIRTTSGSKVLDNFIPPYQSTVVQKLLDAGAILIGKNNLDAWGHGGSTENTDYEAGRNPWDMDRIPGGSSGGPAIAISTRMTSFAIGEDTGGSIRSPASMCNVTGLKVTYGRVSRYGTIAYASSLDSVGPMGKSVEDVALILETIAGQDKKDATSSHRPVPAYSDMLENSLRGKRIGIPKEFLGEGLSPEVRKVFQEAVKKLADLGANIVEVSIPFLKYGVSIYFLIAMSETSSNLGRYDGVRFGNGRDLFSPETLRRIMIGTYALSAGYADKLYKRAQKARTVLIREFEDVFRSCDFVIGPIVPTAPRRIGELINDPLQNLLEDIFTVPINLIGSPSLALPAGFTESNLPIGMQIIGKKFDEVGVLQCGHAYQQATDWHTRKPPLII